MKKMKLFAFVMCVAMLVTLIPTVALAADPQIVGYIDHDITVDTTWPVGEYYICRTEDNNEPIVASGVTLTIESGSKVYFGYRTNVPIPSTETIPYSCLTVNGTLNATGVTFTTIPDVGDQTDWRDAGWMGIEARSEDSSNAASLSFTNCIFEYCCGSGTLCGADSNDGGDNQRVDITVSGCTFENPIKEVTDGLYAAIRYNNGYHLAGTGTLSVSGSNFTDYSHGVLVEGNSRDDIDVSVNGCTFTDIGIMPVTIHSGRSASVTNCTFNNIESIRDGAAHIFTDYEASNKVQTVTLTGNIFNGAPTTTKYPVVVGANVKINENVTSDTSTFSADYPAVYRYIRFSGGIGSTSTTNPSVEHAVWGFTGIPYLMTNGVKVSGNGTKDDGIHSSLEIKPGVTVNFAAGVGLTIDGALTAEGENGNPITFQKQQGADWCFGLEADGALEGPISLKYCNVNDLNSGINVKAPSTATTPPTIAIENCTIQSVNHQTALKGKNITVTDSGFTGLGVDLANSRNVTITDCTITMNAGSWTENGVKIENCDNITLQGCDITSNGVLGGNGVDIYNSKSVLLKNCLVTEFPEYGVSLNRNPYETIEEGAPLIENCTVVSNGYAGAIFRYSGNVNNPVEYSSFIKNSIITNNGVALPEDDPKLDIIRLAGYAVAIPEGSILYSLIGNDDAPFGVYYYSHPSLLNAGYPMSIYPIPTTAYSNRVSGPANFTDAENNDYHLKSAEGRWDGNGWVNDDVTSNCINAGDPNSSFANEPADNGDRINIGRYGNTAEASKLATTNPSYLQYINLPDGKVGQYDAYTITPESSSVSPVVSGESYSFTVTVNSYHYKTGGFAVKVDGVELSSVDNIYTIENITEDKTITVEGIALIQGPTFLAQPQDLTVAPGAPASFSVEVETEGYEPTYKWRVSEDGGENWVDAGDTDAQLNIASTTITQSGWKYICFVYYPYGGNSYSVASEVATLTVVDDETQYSIAVSVSPAAGGAVSGGGSVNAGASVTVTATPNASYNFVKWTESGAQVSTSASYTFNVTGNRTLVAVFESATPPPPPPPPPPSDPPVTNQPVITPPVNEIGNGESITASNLASLISEGKDLIVEDDDGAKLVFNAEALKGISSQAIGSVKAEISDVSDEYQETYPDKLVFSLTVTSGDKVITNFDGSVTVSLPYELKEGEDPKNVKVWHLAADGSMTEIPCTYNPSTKKVSFVVSHFSLYMVGVASTHVNPFTDVNEKDWFYNAVSFAYKNGLMTGTGDTTFSPQANTSRGMIVTILWRLEGEPDTANPIAFTDVDEGKWYHDAVAWASEKGIVDGYSKDKFGPEDNTTREQMAKILCSYAAYKSYDVSARGDLSVFTDSPSNWALEYMQWAVAEGLFQGKGNAILDPLGNTKRSECAAILQRFIEKYNP